MGFTFNEFPWTKYYDSDLREILKYMREFENTLKSYADTASELQEAIKDLDDYDKRIDALEKITSSVPNIISRLTDLENLHTRDVETFKEDIANLQKQINDLDISTIYTYIDTKYASLLKMHNKDIYEVYLKMYELFNGLAERLIKLAEIVNALDTSVYNPWTRILAKESIQKNFNYAYADLADMIPTAEEYSELGLSADNYTVYNLSAYEYSVRGKKWLHMDFVYSPVYGFRQNISNVLTSIVNWIVGTISADEYTALDIDADAYSALDISAEEYYKYRTQQGYLQLGKDGITASQYPTIGA